MTLMNCASVMEPWKDTSITVQGRRLLLLNHAIARCSIKLGMTLERQSRVGQWWGQRIHAR